ncbi:MAG: AAA family ATPase [Candidatus Puniceispirillaceae bacterium]
MKKLRILIFGLPGSGKTTLAIKLARKLGAVHLNADEVRGKFQDWDFSEKGRLRQAFRMSDLAESAVARYVIMDFICPTMQLREIVAADVSIFLNTIVKGRYEDTNRLFEFPADSEKVNYTIQEKDSDGEAQRIANDLMTFD